MGHNQYKLHDLHLSKMSLPGDVLLVLGSHGGHRVVQVHPDVHERVEEAEERAVAPRGELDAHPDGEGHDAVVHHVKQGHVVRLLAQHEEKL